MNPFFADFYAFTKWLYIKIYDGSVFFIDYWSIVHIFSGFLLVILIFALKVKHKKLIFFAGLFLWEISEILFQLFALGIFKPETLKDQITDIIIGTIGGCLAYIFLKYIFKQMDKKRAAPLSATFISAIIFGFNYAGIMQSQYNLQNMMTTGYNLGLFLLCFVLIAILIICFISLLKLFKNITISSIILLGGYYLCFVLIILINYNFLIFITSKSSVFIILLIAPFIIIPIYYVFQLFLQKLQSDEL